MTFLRKLETAARDGADGLRKLPGKVLVKNANGSYQVEVDSARYYQVWSQNGKDYAPGVLSGTLQIATPCIVVIDGYGRATLIP